MFMVVWKLLNHIFILSAILRGVYEFCKDIIDNVIIQCFQVHQLARNINTGQKLSTSIPDLFGDTDDTQGT